MPKVKRHAAPEPSFVDEDVSVSSVVFGLAMIVALIVAAAALMGGSLSKAENRLANTSDGLARSLGVSVSSVRVVGLEHDPVLEADVRAAAMVEPGETMFRADPHRVRARVLGTRQVVNVRVLRLWPDQIVIMADPAEPLALHQRGQDWAVIDTLGQAMAGVDAEDYTHLPRLAGNGAPQAAMELLVHFDQAPELASQVVLAERVDSRRWNLHLDGGSVVLLPRDAGMGGALHTLGRLIRTAPAAAEHAARLDMRDANRAYILPAERPSSPTTRLSGSEA
ncbi:MAG: cell division protein FtsQ/DivIB [Pseudomonadota bacterium]